MFRGTRHGQHCHFRPNSTISGNGQVSVDSAVNTIKKRISNPAEKLDNLYVGIGQYYSDPIRERIVVLSGKFQSSESPPETLLDCSLETNSVDNFLDRIEKLSTNVCYGEVNSVDKGQWNYGFTIKPDFKIFTNKSLVFQFLNNENLQLVNKGNKEDVSLNSIKSVNVHLSEEPWNEQGIDIQLKDDTYMGLVHFEIDNDERDLALLMMDTEWTVKAAALLCLNMKKLGHKVDLKLPRSLTIQGNPWVENRQHTWTRLMLSANNQ